MNYYNHSAFMPVWESQKPKPYPVNDIYGSVQGEGALSGTPMVILRLQGCEVGCSFCDTKFTWELQEKNLTDARLSLLFPKQEQDARWTKKTAAEISEYIQAEFPQYKWVLITGGEPSQYELKWLVRALHKQGFKVALETSGTETGHLKAGFDWITISPKIYSKKRSVDTDAFREVNEVKMVVGKPSDIEDFKEFLSFLKLPRQCVVSLQPMSLSEKATKICMDAATENGWRISLQMHRYLEVR